MSISVDRSGVVALMHALSWQSVNIATREPTCTGHAVICDGVTRAEPPVFAAIWRMWRWGDDIFYEVEQGRLYNLSLFSTFCSCSFSSRNASHTPRSPPPNNARLASRASSRSGRLHSRTQQLRTNPHTPQTPHLVPSTAMVGADAASF